MAGLVLDRWANVHSCIYRGEINHRRFTPNRNRFSYRLHMFWLDLAELPELFNDYRLWSAGGRTVASFQRSDHAGNPAVDLDEFIRSLVEKETGQRPDGAIRLLTHLRYFGYCFNPISVYYCYDRSGDLVNTVLEVSNTPWKERHCYVLNAAGNEPVKRHDFAKAFHVSPFMGLDMQYRCLLRPPGERLNFALQNWRDGRKLFDAHLNLQREPINATSLRRCLLSDPLMTLRVSGLIHWQAVKLWCKRTPLYRHPAKRSRRGTSQV